MDDVMSRYGLKVCCGEEVPDVVFDCGQFIKHSLVFYCFFLPDDQGHWQMYYVDTLCDLGEFRCKHI